LLNLNVAQVGNPCLRLYKKLQTLTLSPLARGPLKGNKYVTSKVCEFVCCVIQKTYYVLEQMHKNLTNTLKQMHKNPCQNCYYF